MSRLPARPIRLSAAAQRCVLAILLLPLIFAAAQLAGWRKHVAGVAAVSSDGRILAAAYCSQTSREHADYWLEVRSLAASRRLALEPLSEGSFALAFSRDGSILAAGLENGEVHLWRLSKRQPVVVHQTNAGPVHSLDFNRDDSALVVGCDSALFLLSVASGEIVAAERSPNEHYWRGALSPDGARLAVSTVTAPPGTVACHVYDVTDQGFEHRCTAKLAAYAQLAWSPDGKFVVIGDGRQVRVLDVRQHTTRNVASTAGNLAGVAFLDDGATIAAASATIAAAGDTPYVNLWDAATGHRTGALRGSSDQSARLSLSADGTTLAATNFAGRVTVWDAVARRCLGEFSIDRWPRFCAWLYLGLFVVWFVVWVRTGVEPGAGARPLADAALLCGVVLAVPLVRIFATPPVGIIFQWQYPVFLGALAGAASLLVVWTITGGGRWARRLPGFLAGAAVLAGIPILLGGAEDPAIFEVTVSTLALLVGLTLIYAALKHWGLCAVQIVEGEVRMLGSGSQGQFSLRDILLWTASAALLLAVARFVSPYSIAPVWVVFLLANGAYVAANAGYAALVGLSARRLVGIPLALGVAVLAGWTPPWPTTSLSVLPDWWYILMQLSACVLILGVLAIFRAHGYRWRIFAAAREDQVKAQRQEPVAEA